MGEIQAKECTPFHNHDSTPRVPRGQGTGRLTEPLVDLSVGSQQWPVSGQSLDTEIAI